jgi:hypothetical protein
LAAEAGSMWIFETLCDEFYVATRLFLKLELTPSRETLLHFCEQMRRAFPGMSRFRRRSDGAVVLDEEDREQGGRRYIRLSSNALRFAQFSPPSRDAVSQFGRVIFNQAPAHLSFSDLDYQNLEVVYAFDLEYAGNHDELVAEALLSENPLLAAVMGDSRRIIDCQPCVGVTLSEDLNTQAYIDVRGRTSMYEIRSGEYEPQPLSVYLTLRRDLRNAPADLARTHQELLELGEEFAASRVVPHVVRPLREAIASRR